MTSSVPRTAIALGVLIGLSIPVLFMGLGDYSVVDADEAFYHDVAWTMFETGDYWKVRTGPGEHVYDTFANAPLQYWARALVISWIGPGLFGMRILSALAGLLAVLATFGLVLRRAGRGAGFLAGLLLLTNYQFVFLHGARTGELETGVALLLVLIAGLFVRTLERPARGFLLHHVCLALLFGWKAPVAPIPVLAELVCFALLPAARPTFVAWLRAGVFVAPWALGWHAGQAWRLHAVLPDVIAAVGDQAGRDSDWLDRFVEHAHYYARRIGFGAWPQIALLPAAIASLLAGGAARARDGGLMIRVIAIQFVTVLVFYCAIAKLGPWYVSHAYPFMAALIAFGMSDLQSRRGLPIFSLAWLAFGIAAALFVAPPLFGYDPFAASAIRIPMPLAVRSIGSWSTAASIALVGAASLCVAVGATRRGRSTRPVILVATWLVAGVSLARVISPLASLERVSAQDALRNELAERRATGHRVSFPIDVPPAHPWIVHYAFGHEYALREAPRRPGDPPAPDRRFVLVGERTREQAAAGAPESAGNRAD